jgi:hypothetical protein
VATSSAIPLTLGVIALVGMPAAIAAVICADEVVETVKQRAEAVRSSWQDQRTIDRLERALAPAPPAGPPWAAVAKVASEALSAAGQTVATFAAQRLNAVGLAPAWLPAPAQAGQALVPFEEVVAQLRDLPRADSRYDDALIAACLCLGVSHHLHELTGLDREIERLRVEGALIEAGLTLSTE